MNCLGPGSALGRYELLTPIAQGGMAQVWLARLCGSRGFQKIVAVKTILESAMGNKDAEEMFLEEARLAAQVHHPNCVTTLELGEERGTLYLAMEWVNGRSLRKVQRDAVEAGGLPRSIALNIIAQACKGLHAAHEARDNQGKVLSIVHRDVSPQNVLVSYGGTVKLADFGIAKATNASSELTEQGVLKGKAPYMSPELILERPLDRRSDIFSLGLLLYGLTTGRHPYRAGNIAQTLRNICDVPTVLPSLVAADYPPELESIVMRSLEKDPADRYQSAAEMFNALAALAPDAVSGKSEDDLAEYMSQRCPGAASQALLEVASAQRKVDQLHGEAPLSGPNAISALPPEHQTRRAHATGLLPPSPGPLGMDLPDLSSPRLPTLNPVSRDLITRPTQDETTAQSLRAPELVRQTLEGATATTMEEVVSFRRPAQALRRLAVGAALVLGNLFTWFRLQTPPEMSIAAKPNSPRSAVQTGAAAPGLAAKATAPPPIVSTPPSATAPHSPSSAKQATKMRASKTQRKRRRRLLQTSQPREQPSAAVSANQAEKRRLPATASTGSHELTPPTNAKSKPDAWDPDDFGGRN